MSTGSNCGRPPLPRGLQRRAATTRPPHPENRSPRLPPDAPSGRPPRSTLHIDPKDRRNPAVLPSSPPLSRRGSESLHAVRRHEFFEVSICGLAQQEHRANLRARAPVSFLRSAAKSVKVSTRAQLPFSTGRYVRQDWPLYVSAGTPQALNVGIATPRPISDPATPRRLTL